MSFDGVTYLRCENCGGLVVEGEAEAHERGCRREGAVVQAHFVILVHRDRAPMLLGPMLEQARVQHMRELRERYADSGVHALDVTVRSGDRVTAEVKRYEPEGDSAA